MADLRQLDSQVVVVGGGPAGVCAAIGAARAGAQVVLVQDRPVLGGNSSSEVRVHVTGADASGGRPHAREGGIIEELRLAEAVRNPQRCAEMWDMILWEWVTREPNITLLLNTACTGVEKEGERLVAIHAARENTEDRFLIRGQVFIDCTGDGRVGYDAGAEFRMGREGPDEFDEPHAEGPDSYTMGNSLMFCARNMGVPVPFVAPDWAYTFETDEDLPHRHGGHEDFSHGHWWIEYGGELDTVKDAEKIRDHLLACLMGFWDHVKNRGRHGADNWALTWFAFVPGKRESRRIIGEHILSERDLVDNVQFSDAVAHGGWPLDTHPPGGIHSSEPPCKFLQTVDVYGIPLRCLIARDVPNLMLAGRCASATHMGMASTRVMATCAVMGQAAGTAAAFAVARGCLPKEVASEHIADLQQTLLRADQYVPGVVNADPLDRARLATVTASGNEAGCEASKVIDGTSRRLGEESHQWASDPTGKMPQWLQLDFPEPVAVRELHLTFDTGFGRPLCLTQADGFNARMIRGPQPETVRDYAIEVLRDGQWVEVERFVDNIWRKVVHNFAGLTAQSLRLRVDRTNGDAQARVFEVRVYE